MSPVERETTLHGLPFPGVKYLVALGRVAYAVAYLEWAVLGDLALIPGLPPELQLDALEGLTSHSIGRKLTDPKLLDLVSDPRVREWLEAGGRHLTAVATKRNSVLHARPATVDGRQRLTRLDRRREEIFTITDELLDELLRDIAQRVRDIDNSRVISV
jgi:hypothetical protein